MLNYLKKYWHRCVAACCACAALLPPPALAGPASDTLSMPAKMSVRSSSSVMLAVTRAGARLVAVGERGVILMSDDNAKSWKQAPAPVSVTLTSVHFASASKGWAVGHGGVVLHSGDGGNTWVKQFDGLRAAQAMLALAKSDPSAGAQLAEAERMVADGADKPFLDVYFPDERRGLIVGAYGLIFSTSDGGRSWQGAQASLSNPKGRHLYDIHVAGSDWYIAGEQGALYRSEDQGHRWEEIKTPYAGSYFGLVATKQGELVVFGLPGNALWSADRGKTWHRSGIGMPITLTTGLQLADGRVILADEAGHVLHSGDAGRTFKPLAVPSPAPFTGSVLAANGALVLSGARGMTLIAAQTLPMEPSK